MNYESTIRALDKLWERTTTHSDAVVLSAAMAALIALRNDLRNEQTKRVCLEELIKVAISLEPFDGDGPDDYANGYSIALRDVRAVLGVTDA